MANIEVIYSVEQFISIILRTTQSETESVIEHECHRQDIRFLDCCVSATLKAVSISKGLISMIIFSYERRVGLDCNFLSRIAISTPNGNRRSASVKGVM